LPGVIDGRPAWFRLAVSMLISAIGGVGMWSVVVALPAIEAEFGAARGGASLPYTLTMLGFGAGGVLLGGLADRRGIVLPVAMGGVALGLGYALASQAAALWQFAILHGVLIGLLGSASSFGPLIAEISHWFDRRRGIAVAICASGNYAAGTIWPPVVQHFIATEGWRATYLGIGIFCAATILPLSLLLRGKRPATAAGRAAPPGRFGTLNLSPGALQAVLAVAGVACCVAMSMPQVHIVAYCGDLGFGVAAGARMLSLMLGLGIISRIASGFIADRIGGLATLMLGSALQGLALLLYLGFRSLPSLYVVSGLFGLFQGGIVPSYAIIVREYFPPREAGARVGIVLMATLVGMALGGWMSGVIYDITGSYRAAFANGLAWNVLNGLLAASLLLWRRHAIAAA
jgi:MFS family permease